MSGFDLATVADVVAIVPQAGDVGPSSTGIITVALTPVPAGETLTYAGLTLTSVAGARTSGSNDFDGSLGTTALIAADILAAIADAANSWATVVTSSISGSIVALTTIAQGYNTVDPLVSSDASMTTTGMTGGDALIAAMVNTAGTMINAGCWGVKTCDGSAYLALHFLSSVQGGLPGGKSPVSSIKIKDIAKTYAAATPSNDIFGSTAWGQMYLALWETVWCEGGVTGSNECLTFGVVC